MHLLEVEGVSKLSSKGFSVKNVSFVQKQFQKIAIAGETGSGKSTLLKMIAGLEQPDSGDVYLQGKRVKGPYEKLIAGYPQIAYLSQHYELRHHYTVEEILTYANKLSEERAQKIYDICKIHHLFDRKSDQLSGGEQQRVALARLLITAPELLLLDEPFSNLDMVHKATLKEVIKDIGQELHITCMLVSHDPLDTLSWADEILVMKDGELVQQGTPFQIYKQPRSEYVAALFGKYNLLSPERVEKLFRLKDTELTGHQIILRPEDIVLLESGLGGEATVIQISYFGSFYELEVFIDNFTLTVRTHSKKYTVGDRVWLALPR